MTRPSDAFQQPAIPMLFEEAQPFTDSSMRREVAILSVDTLYECADQELMRILKEDKRVERKVAGFLKSRELADYYSMWANTGPEGGLIAVGVSDSGEVVGCSSIEVEYLNSLEQEAGNQCPDARVYSKRINAARDKDGKADFVHLYRVKFNPSRVVFTTRNEAFIRRGESKHRLTHHEIIDLANDKGEVRVEQELCPEYNFPDDFRTDLVGRFVAAVNANLKEPLSPVDILTGRHLGTTKDGRFVPNAACVLLFASDPRIAFAGAKIFLMRFAGDHEGVGKDLNTVKHGFVEGNIPELLDNCADFLKSQLREFSSLGDDNRFYPSPEYPRDVWYEAIVNACVHRSYGTFKKMAIYVKMFDSRLEIESPGGFPPGINADNIYSAISHPRNPFMMEALWFLGYVRNIGEGTRRMLKLMEDSDLPKPEINQKEIGHTVVRVTLRNNLQLRKVLLDSAVAASVISPEVYKTLSEDERKLVNYLAEHKTINTSQAMRITGRGWKSAHRALTKLQHDGILRHLHRSDIDRDPAAHFVLSPAKRRKDSTDKG